MKVLPVEYFIGPITVMLFFFAGCAASGIRTESQTPERNLLPLQRPIPPDWRTVNLGKLILSVPTELKRADARGIDSAAWEFVSQNSRMIVDLGDHSNDLSTYSDWPNYREAWVTVDSRKAKLCTFRHSPRFMDSADEDRIYIAAIYFPNDNLWIWFTSKDEKEQLTAETILSSIKFAK